MEIVTFLILVGMLLILSRVCKKPAEEMVSLRYQVVMNHTNMQLDF